MEDEMKKSKMNYGKRPLWQWFEIYIVIGGVLYAGVYYFVLGRKNVYSTSQVSNSVSQQQMPSFGY